MIFMREYFEKIYTKSSKEYYIKLSKYLDNNQKKFIITANPETIKIAQEDEVLSQELLDSKNDVIADGIAIVKAAKHYKINIPERITGCETAEKLLELANQKKKSIYLFGAKKEVLDTLIEKIKIQYPKIKILGFSDGYVENKEEVFREIIELRPDVCLVALGIPLQEKLIAKFIDNVDKGIYMGVGGTFDVLSGVKKRAPKIFIKLNLEWLYRIIKEPYRLKRFFNNNVKFIFEVLKDKN